MYQVKVSNLPRWISELHLKQFFSTCGKPVDSKIALDTTTFRPLGHGYLDFADEESMQKALNKNGSIFDGATIEVEVAVETAE